VSGERVPARPSLVEATRRLRRARAHLDHVRTGPPMRVADARELVVSALRDYISAMEGLGLPVPERSRVDLKLLEETLVDTNQAHGTIGSFPRSGTAP
jgi:hypothetical protein